jgi:hypothetical protein
MRCVDSGEHRRSHRAWFHDHLFSPAAAIGAGTHFQGGETCTHGCTPVRKMGAGPDGQHRAHAERLALRHKSGNAAGGEP